MLSTSSAPALQTRSENVKHLARMVRERQLEELRDAVAAMAPLPTHRRLASALVDVCTDPHEQVALPIVQALLAGGLSPIPPRSLHGHSALVTALTHQHWITAGTLLNHARHAHPCESLGLTDTALVTMAQKGPMTVLPLFQRLIEVVSPAQRERVAFHLGSAGGRTVGSQKDALTETSRDHRFLFALLDHGVNVNARDPQRQQRTLLHMAILLKDVPLVEHLVNHGADTDVLIRTRSKQGDDLQEAKISHCAVLVGHVPTVRTLLKQGVSFTEPCRDGHVTALDLARRSGSLDIVSLVERQVLEGTVENAFGPRPTRMRL